MLHLICGADRLQNTDTVISRICQQAQKGIGDQILIVPEQFSHEAERTLCDYGGDSISRYAEVLSFSRLAGRVSSLYGGVCEEYLDRGGRLLSVYRAAQQVLHELRYFAAAVTRAEFLQQLGAAFEEFLSYELPPQALQQAAEQLSGQFAQKTKELGLLYESYLSVCAQSRSDPVTRLSRLSQTLLDVPYAETRSFYLDGFSDFTGAEMQIIASLLSGSSSVTITLTTDGSTAAAFQTANETARQLKLLAATLDVAVRSERCAMAQERSEVIRFWLTELFSRSDVCWQQPQEAVFLHNADSLDDECAFAAQTVRNLTREGFRYREICIAVTDEARYTPALRSLLKRSGIPAYYSGNEQLRSLPLIAFVLAALRASERYETQDVLQYLKSGFGPVSLETADELERYARLWSIRGVSWQQPWKLHPRGFAEQWKPEDEQTLSRLEAWRQTAIAPLSALREALHRAKTVQQQLQALADFFERIDLCGTLERQSQLLYAAGQAQRAQQTQQLYDILVNAMEQAYRTIGDAQMPPEQFTQLFSLLLGCYQVGSIPANVDEVQVGTLSTMRHKRVRALIVLGAEEEKLPAFAPQPGILTDDERQRLLGMGLQLAPTQQQRLEREFGWIYAAFSAAQSRVFLCCASDTPSFLFTRTQNMFPALRVSTTQGELFIADEAAAAALLSRRGETDAPWLSPQLREKAQQLHAQWAYTFTPLATRTVQGLYGQAVQLSASKIDLFSACKMAYFLRYGLKAEPWKTAELNAPVFGTFVHYVLEHTVRDVMARGGFHALDEQQVLQLAQTHIDAYSKACLSDLQNQPERVSYLFLRNLDEVKDVVLDVAQELRQSAFEPAAQELSFSDDGALPAITVPTPLGTGVVSGFVDRVDVYRQGETTYYRVVDYKTGGKEFDYADILLAEGMQMLIYLFALKRASKGENAQPAGVLYIPAKCPMQRLEAGMTPHDADQARAKALRRKGLLLLDESVLEAMEKDFAQGRYLPLKQKKDGTITGDVAEREQLALLEHYVQHKLQELTQQLLRGEITPNPIIRGPMQGTCRYCDFAQVCHKDSCRHENRYIKAVSAENFWRTVEQEEQSHG